MAEISLQYSSTNVWFGVVVCFLLGSQTGAPKKLHREDENAAWKHLLQFEVHPQSFTIAYYQTLAKPAICGVQSRNKKTFWYLTRQDIPLV